MKKQNLNVCKATKKRIVKQYEKCIESNFEATADDIEFGGLCEKLQTQLNKKEITFKEYREKHFQHINERFIQRCSELARHVDINKFPNLPNLSKRTLKILIDISGKKDVGNFLDGNGILLDFKDTYTNVYKFKHDVRELIAQIIKSERTQTDNNSESEKEPKPDKKKKSLNYKFYLSIKRKNKKIKKSNLKLSEKQKKKYRMIYQELDIFINSFGDTWDEDDS